MQAKIQPFINNATDGVHMICYSQGVYPYILFAIGSANSIVGRMMQQLTVASSALRFQWLIIIACIISVAMGD